MRFDQIDWNVRTPIDAVWAQVSILASVSSDVYRGDEFLAVLGKSRVSPEYPTGRIDSVTSPASTDSGASLTDDEVRAINRARDRQAWTLVRDLARLRRNTFAERFAAHTDSENDADGSC